MEFWGISVYYWIIALPAVSGLCGFALSRLRTEFNFIGFIGTLFFAIRIFIGSQFDAISHHVVTIMGIDFRLYVDDLSRFVLLLNAVFTFLIWLYSLRAMSKAPREKVYYLYMSLTLAAANGIAASGNLLFLLVFWNVLLFSHYGLLMVGKRDSTQTARTALSIIGPADYLMMLGIVLLFVETGTLDIPFAPRISVLNHSLVASYVLICIGVIAKLGVLPLHRWIPASATAIPASTFAIIPASLDRVLGIYFLFRVSYFVFEISTALPIRMILMTVGALSIVAAVVMAMIQKDIMKFLSYHVISQTGYMMLGIGTGISIGIVGGLFHMLSATVCLTCLFLAAGSIEHRTKTTVFDNLGGLRTRMPVTMFSLVLAALALSGVPPLSGFFSYRMIYQGLIDLSRESPLWLLFLVAAVFGSIFTCASFLHMLRMLFFGERPKTLGKVREARFEMVTSTVLLAVACIVFGVLASAIPINYFILPSLPFSFRETSFLTSAPVTLLIGGSIILGIVVFIYGIARRMTISKVMQFLTG